MPRFKYTLRHNVPTRFKDYRFSPKDHRYFQKGSMGCTPRKDGTFRDKYELRRKKLCFTCWETWVLGHKCAKGNTYCIEVLSKGGFEYVSEDEE